MKRSKNTALKGRVNNRVQKCFKCKKVINWNSSSLITLYSVSDAEKGEEEYNFCSEECLDGFFQDKVKFRAIVREFERDE